MRRYFLKLCMLMIFRNSILKHFSSHLLRRWLTVFWIRLQAQSNLLNLDSASTGLPWWFPQRRNHLSSLQLRKASLSTRGLLLNKTMQQILRLKGSRQRMIWVGSQSIQLICWVQFLLQRVRFKIAALSISPIWDRTIHRYSQVPLLRPKIRRNQTTIWRSKSLEPFHLWRVS